MDRYVGRAQCGLLVILKVTPRLRDHPLGQSRRELRLAHSTIQRLFLRGRRLQDVVASLQQVAEQLAHLPMIGVAGQKKRYSRDNRKL